MRIIILLGAVLALAGAMGVGAREVPDPAIQRLTLRDAIRIALLNNRELQIQRINPEIARLTLSSSYGYYDPVFIADTRQEDASDSGGFDPADFSRDAIYTAESVVTRMSMAGFLPSGLSYSLNGDYASSRGTRNGLNFESYKVSTGVFVRQPLLKDFWIDQGRLNIQIRRRDLTISELGVQHVTMSTINEVQQAYGELQFARANAGVYADLLNSRRRTLAGVERTLQGGLGTISEERLARSQVALVEIDIATASNAVSRAEHELKTLLGDRFTNPVGSQVLPSDHLITVSTRLDLLESFQHGIQHRPDLAQLKEDVEKSRLDLKFRRNQIFPGLDVIASYKRQGSSASQVLPPATASASFTEAADQWRDGDSPTDMLGFLFTLPLSRKAERANFRAGKQLMLQAELRVKQHEELVLREISDAIANARMSLARVDAARRARAEAEGAAEDEEKKLAAGTSTIFFVLQQQDGLTRARTAEIRAAADYNRAVSQLHFAEGTLLERTGVRLDVK